MDPMGIIHIPIPVQLKNFFVQGRTSRLMHFAEQQRAPGGSMAPWEVSKSPRDDLGVASGYDHSHGIDGP